MTTKSGVEYNFNTQGRLSEQSDPNGNTLTFTYDANGYLTAVANSFGRSLALAYNNNRIESISSAGWTVYYAYDSFGRLTGFTDAEGEVTSYVYDDSYRMVRYYLPADPDTPQVVNAYDDLDRVITQSIAAGPLYTYTTPAGGPNGSTPWTGPRSGISKPTCRSTCPNGWSNTSMPWIR